MFCIYLVDNQFVFYKLRWLFCIIHSLLHNGEKKTIIKNITYNGGFGDFMVIFIIAFVLATISLLNFFNGIIKTHLIANIRALKIRLIFR